MKKLMYFLVFLGGMAFCQAQNYYSFNWTHQPFQAQNGPGNDAEVRVNLENGSQVVVYRYLQDPTISREILNLPSKIASVRVNISYFPSSGQSCSNTETFLAGACGSSFTHACTENLGPGPAIFGDFRLIEIAPQGVDTSFKECEEIAIPVSAPCANTNQLRVVNWFYKLPNQPRQLLVGHAGERTLRFNANELSNNPADYLNLSEDIELIPEFELYPASEVIPYRITIRPCPPNLVGEEFITENAMCFGDEGTVTLRFDSDNFTSGGDQYQMRYFVYDSSVDLTSFDPDTDNPPSTTDDAILSLTPANDGTGHFLGTFPNGYHS